MRTKEIVKDNAPLSIFKSHHRFLRSTHLERDWIDPSALDNYVFTQHAQQSLTRLSLGLQKSSALRAWRITGDYGSGKSSFALLLANLLEKRNKYIPLELRNEIKGQAGIFLRVSQPNLMAVLVTGNRESIGYAILRALIKTLKEAKVHGGVYSKLQELLTTNQSPSDEIVLEWIFRVKTYLVKSGISAGVALIIDEAGKFLEFAALNPERQDVYLMQSLAEIAARSAGEPFYVVSIFHQGISAYTENLSKAQQKEWEKVAGRYEEIAWHYPVEQTAQLIAKSLNVDSRKISKRLQSKLRIDMQEALKLGVYGLAVNRTELKAISEKLYPIHPVVVPVLLKLFATFGQNERSLFSFLLGVEPHGLQEFVVRTKGQELFTLHHLFDYSKSTFGNRLGSSNYHWKEIENTVSNVGPENRLSLQILKTIGLLNLINSSELVATRELLLFLFDDTAKEEFKKLEDDRLIFFRGKAAGYCLWPNTSVNLQEAYSQAKKLLGKPRSIASLVKQRLESRPIVARRHYIETGNLRYFEVRYVDVASLSPEVKDHEDADGLIIIPLCETPQDVAYATAMVKSITEHAQTAILFAIPSPLTSLSGYLEELMRWEWIERSIGELRQDNFAREEVVQQITLSKLELTRHVQSLMGMRFGEGDSELKWYQNGQLVPTVSSGRSLMSYLSDLCDRVYNRSPKFQNELANRRAPSSAAVAARQKLIERILELSESPLLGMEEQKHPPEMSMYLSILKESGLHNHIAAEGRWTLSLPTQDYDSTHCGVLASMQHMHQFLSQRTDQRVAVLDVCEALKRPPFGIREGIIPILLATFACIHEQELAFYEDGSFIPRITGSHFVRLIKAPETFEIQYYHVGAVRSALFQRITSELGLKRRPDSIAILDVVRPLMVFVSGLPEFVLKTNSLDPITKNVRNALTTKRDPVALLFSDLPIACGLDSFLEEKSLNEGNTNLYAQRLKAAIDELRAAYPKLLEHIQHRVFGEFEMAGSFAKQREDIAVRSGSILGFVSEIALRSFCLRLADSNLPNNTWLESLGNLLCSMPPTKWRDSDIDKFNQEIHRHTRQFLRVESLIFANGQGLQDRTAIRIALTKQSGEEKEAVIRLDSDQMDNVDTLKAELTNWMKKHGQVGMVAASQALWQIMKAGTE